MSNLETDEERASHHPFGPPDRRSAFTPERVAIETEDGDVVDAIEEPRASFADHTLETQWSTLQLAYFVGTATSSPTTTRSRASSSRPSTGSSRATTTASRFPSRSSSRSISARSRSPKQDTGQ
jgi:hypothetical protein